MRVLIASLIVVAAVWALLVAGLFLTGRRSEAREVAKFLPNLILLFKDLVKDPRVPRGSKVLVFLGVLWFASPIDLIPEFIPVAGPLDDAIVASLILRHILKRAGEAIVRDHWRGSDETLRILLRLSGAQPPAAL